MIGMKISKENNAPNYCSGSGLERLCILYSRSFCNSSNFFSKATAKLIDIIAEFFDF